jgi:hypothetical protein
VAASKLGKSSSISVIVWPWEVEAFSLCKDFRNHLTPRLWWLSLDLTLKDLGKASKFWVIAYLQP